MAENPPITREADLEERLYVLEKAVSLLAVNQDPRDHPPLYTRLQQSIRSYEMRKAAEHHQVEMLPDDTFFHAEEPE